MGKTLNIVEYAKIVMEEYNYMDSKGSVVLRNGVLIHVTSYFDYFVEAWNEFKKIVSKGVKSEIKTFLVKKTNGGIVSNGEVFIYLPDVSIMIKN